MKKRRKIFQRAAALLCCIVVLSCFLVIPVAASEEDSTYFNVLSYSYPNNGDTAVLYNSPTSFYFSVPKIGYLYIDMIVRTDSGSFAVSYAGSPLTCEIIDSGEFGYVYRIYGNLKGYGDGMLWFDCTNAGSFVSFMSVRASTLADFYYPTIGGLRLTPVTGSSGIAWMSSATTPVSKLFYQNNGYYWENGTIEMFVRDWRKFDFVDVFFSVNASGIRSLVCELDGISIPYEISFIDSSIPSYDDEILDTSNQSYPVDLAQYCIVTLDLRDLDRSVSYDGYPCIQVNCKFPQDSGSVSGAVLLSVVGRLTMDNPTELDGFWFKLKSFLSDIFTNDPAADEAQQTQEQVDYEINLQIVDAMENWDRNIDYAETQFSAGLTRVSPAVAWLSLLSARIFTNMGDFSAMYIIVGFMSVIMLLLSKSGVAAKLGNMGNHGNVRNSSNKAKQSNKGGPKK